MTAGERVYQLRKQLGLTMERFGEGLGVTKVAVSNIEKGNRRLTEQMAVAICKVYRVSYDWLLYGSGTPFLTENQAPLEELALQYQLEAEEVHLLRTWLQLPGEERKSLSRLLQTLAVGLTAPEEAGGENDRA